MKSMHQLSIELRSYVGLDDAQLEKACQAWPYIESDVSLFVDDFYDQIWKHEATRQILRSPEQIERLKLSLHNWIRELFIPVRDEQFVSKRWAIGLRHLHIGLPSLWVAAAMSRLRDQMLQSLVRRYPQESSDLWQVMSAVTRAVDFDLAIIQDAYQAESVAMRIAQERDFAEDVIETAQALVMMIEADGRIVRTNQVLAKQLGWSSKQAEMDNGPTLSWLDLIAQDDHQTVIQFIRSAVAGVSPPPIEVPLRFKDSAPIYVRWHARNYERTAISSSEKPPVQPLVLCVGQDVTELTEAQLRLVRSERLAAIGQTMTGLAHESRNAFQRSQAALETLALELEERPNAAKLVERIQRAHDHLLHLYEEVLQFARPVRLDLQKLEIHGLIQQTWDHIRMASSEKKIQLLLKSTEPHELQGDPFALEQVFRNLLENAIEASPDGSCIELSVSEHWLGASRGVEVRVRDFGVGLKPEAIERAFEPFFTTRVRGTGLGLPIARRMVESHGGTLVLTAQQPGTCAIVTLPLVAKPVEFSDATLATDYRRIQS